MNRDYFITTKFGGIGKQKRQITMEAQFSALSEKLFNVFRVIQIAPDTFLEDLIGFDYIIINASTSSEIHRHNNSDNVIFVIRGAAILILDGVEYNITCGMRVVIPRGMSHGFRTSSEGIEFISAQVPPILDKRKGIFDREVLE